MTETGTGTASGKMMFVICAKRDLNPSEKPNEDLDRQPFAQYEVKDHSQNRQFELGELFYTICLVR